jgi:uncharacterized membrane protein YdjX (TVP38/TMEM64 family)
MSVDHFIMESPLASVTFALRGGADVAPTLDTLFSSAKDIVVSMGPFAPLGFSLVFIGFDLISLPPVPLAVFAGAFFGLLPGTALVLACGIISAGMSFVLGRAFREKLLAWLQERPSAKETFEVLDRIITKGGFKAMVLTRLVPLPLPFLNYLYGITDVKLPSFLAASALGYAPSTFAIVYSGAAGKELLSGGLSQPWYVYTAAALALIGFGKLATDVTNGVFLELSATDAVDK